jgi:hypothetical protein
VAIGGDGTVTAGAALDLSKANGGLLLPQVASNPTSGDLLKRGMMIYNTTTKNTYTYDGAAWVGSEITINGGGTEGSGPAPVNPVLPGSCTDYNENSWRVGNVCIYPTEVTSVYAGTTGGCEIGWNVISLNELVDVIANQDYPTYPMPPLYNRVLDDVPKAAGDSAIYWLRDLYPMFAADNTMHGGLLAWPFGQAATSDIVYDFGRLAIIWDSHAYNGSDRLWVTIKEHPIKMKGRIRCTRPI